MLERLMVSLLAVLVLLVVCSSASALENRPGWEVTGRTFPTNLPPGGEGTIQLNVYNVGGAPTSGATTVTDVLPEGVTYTGPVGKGGECSGTTVLNTWVVTCNIPFLHVGRIWQLGLGVSVESGLSGTAMNNVTVAGGGALLPASVSEPLTFSSKQAGFGLSDFDVWFTNADGTPDTQAGSHPYETTVTFDLNNKIANQESVSPAGGILRTIDVTLPPGIVGNPTAVPQCTRQEFEGKTCPVGSQIGVERFASESFNSSDYFELPEVPVYNMVPPAGVPAQFGFVADAIATFVDAGVRSGSDYGVTEHTDNIDQEVRLLFNRITIWGVPAEASHNNQRYGCGNGTDLYEAPDHEPESVGCASGAGLAPLLTLPTSCSGPQTVSGFVGTWENASVTGEASVVLHDAGHAPVGFTGCDHLGFAPTISVMPDTSFADTPAGLTVEVKAPQEGLANVEGVAVSNIEDTTVTLPEGIAINPGQAAGLQACPETETSLKANDDAPVCPNASKVGTVSIETPLLAKKLEGDVYILQGNPPNLRLLVAASGEGVNLKLVGDVHLDEATGRLTSTFSGTPELPFTDFKLSFSGGAQAALVTPTECGVYSTTSDFTPWSSPFVQDVSPTSGFQIDSGTNGAPCPGSSLPFSPSLTAGSTTDQAGGFTSFSLLLQAPDDQKRIEKLQFKVPQGLLGMISRIPLCPEPQAQNGTCGSASQIGHTVVASGPGPYPLVVPQPGQPPAAIYLTGAYKGAPYGLSIVVPVVVGPFTLQTQIVRARIEVDPLTAQITVTTDPLPQMIDGVPTDLRTVNAVIDRPGFMFNPTNCSPMSFSGTAWGTPPPGVGGAGSTAAISSPFQMGSCRSLLFKPNFKVSTNGKTSRKSGASLTAKILYPTGALGANQASGQSNIASVKVDLPKQLPSRLTTLQKACPVATFNANPAACPKESVVGHATATTPVLPVPVTGPAYFVSHAGEEFPQLIMVLQGYGVTIDLVGSTFINNKTNVTSSTFKRVPDVPITSFELNLPQGPFSALAAPTSLCGKKLVMPTAFTGQNGATIKQSTPITITGCAKIKKKTKRAGHHSTKKGKKGKKKG